MTLRTLVASVATVSLLFPSCAAAESETEASLPTPATAPSEASAADAEIASHPRELEFPPLKFSPPSRLEHRHRLTSGAIAYVVEDHSLPLVDVEVTVRTGSYLESAEKAGLAGAVGYMLRAGGTRETPPSAFDEELDFLAAQMSTSIGAVEGSASFNCLTKDLDRVLALFMQMIRTPGFDEERFSVYRAQLLQALERRNDRTAGIESREWGRLIRGDEFFSLDRTTKASLESWTRDDLAAFHRATFHPSRFVIAVSGDIDTKTILEKLDQHLTSWTNAVEATPIEPIPDATHNPKPGLYVVHKDGVNQGRVSLGHLAVEREHADYAPLIVMNHILGGGGFTSRITSRVRSDKGLAYTARSALQLGVHYAGTFRVYFQSKSESVAEATATVLEEIERIRSTPITESELRDAKQYLVGIFPRYFSSAVQVAGTFADDEFTSRPATHWDTYRERIESVTVADVQRVARDHLHPDRLVILAVGDRDAMLAGNPDAAEFQLRKLAPGDAVTEIPLPDPLELVYP